MKFFKVDILVKPPLRARNRVLAANAPEAHRQDPHRHGALPPPKGANVCTSHTGVRIACLGVDANKILR